MSSFNPSKSSKAVISDMRSASPEVLRQTARDVFREKIIGKENVSSEGGVIDNHTTNVVDALSETDRVPKYQPKDLMIGRVVGRGTFCVVRECNLNATSNGSIGSASSRGSLFGRFSSTMGSVRNLSLNSSNHYKIPNSSGHRSVSSERSRSSVPNRFRRQPGNRSRYVVKQLSPELKDSDKISFLKGTVDLAMETRILASLDHDNIVKLEATSACDAFSAGYFIVLERVNLTLSRKIKQWMDVDRQCKGITGVFTGSKSKVQRLLSDRITAAYDLSVGLNYIHKRKIVFRDLKPDNVGFNYVGILKIFDFGLAKELKESDRTKDGLYKMTKQTGAVRYMSPENAQGKPYDLSTDVYSWAMIMWFIMALEPPFALYTEPMIEERVCRRGYRPKLFKTWSPRISKLISKSWNAKPKDRPSFAKIADELKKELADVDPRLAEMVEKSDALEMPGIQE